MDQVDILHHSFSHLSDALAEFQPPPCDPLTISPWVAMSLMQKAVRRGRKDLAFRAAVTLLRESPERFWRRLGCIAFEDIGVADLGSVLHVTVAMAGKRFRSELGGEWTVGSFLISRLSDAMKCRAADDLLLAAENHPGFEDERLAFAFYSIDELTQITLGVEPLPIRALATWFAIGTDRRPSRRLSWRQGDPVAMFNALRAVIDHAVVDIAQEGFRRTGEVLAPFVALLWPAQRQMAPVEDDELPAEVMIGDVPGWAYDVYSREGRAALTNFINGSTETARWVRARIPSRQRIAFLGGIVFRLEGGLVRRRLRWKTADELRRMVDIEGNGPHCRDATEILQSMRSDIPTLNDVRAALIAGRQNVQ